MKAIYFQVAPLKSQMQSNPWQENDPKILVIKKLSSKVEIMSNPSRNSWILIFYMCCD